MSDYALTTNQPKRVTLAGVDYRVPPLTPHMLGELDEWLKQSVPDPRKEIIPILKDLPLELQKETWADAMERANSWPPTFYDGAGQSLLLTTNAGRAQLLYTTLRRTTEGFTKQKAAEMEEVLTTEEFTELCAALMPQDALPPKDEAAVIPIQATPLET